MTLVRLVLLLVGVWLALAVLFTLLLVAAHMRARQIRRRIARRRRAVADVVPLGQRRIGS